MSTSLEAAPPPRVSYWKQLQGMGLDWVTGWREALSTRNVAPDVVAGLTVAAVAMPLNLALAVASGLPPVAGLVAGAVGGGLAAFFGGAPLQVTGPAAALSTLVFALVAGFLGFTGLAATAAGIAKILFVVFLVLFLVSLIASRGPLRSPPL